jgi:aarF domain-containing kinase
MFSLKKLIGCSTFGVIAGTAYRLKSNDYDVNSLGEVRLCRSAKAVFDVALIYKSNLYYKEWDKSSKEYFQEKKKVHKLAAEKLLELCCKNKGTYIKIGQYIASLEYLVPSEYVEVMKILHSKAPENSIEDVYKVLKQDLNADVSRTLNVFLLEVLPVITLYKF